VTIRQFRFYFYPTDKGLERTLTFNLWGFAEWFVRRLKPIRERLRGPEAKGVNIVNVMLHEVEQSAGFHGTWRKVLNSFEYNTVYDLQTLSELPRLESIERLMSLGSAVTSTAPWPQVVAISEALSVPLTEHERQELLPFLQWPRGQT
jgi:hypothetical protein